MGPEGATFGASWIRPGWGLWGPPGPTRMEFAGQKEMVPTLHAPSDGRSPERPVEENCWELAPGLFRIQLPLPWDVPFVNAYLVQAPAGWILVDAGVGTPASLRALGWALRAVGVPEGGLTAILLTHRHPDHAGDVITVQRRWGGAVYVHAADLDLDRAAPAALDAWIRLTGMPGEVMDALLRRVERMPLPDDAVAYPEVPPLANGWRQAGAEPAAVPAATVAVAGLTLQVVYVPGHSPGHVMLRVPEKGWVFTGDHVLPRAGMNVWANPVGPANPMGAYLDNLAAVAWLDAVWGAVSGGTAPAPREDAGAGAGGPGRVVSDGQHRTGLDDGPGEGKHGVHADPDAVGAGGTGVAPGKTGTVGDRAPSGRVLPGQGTLWSGLVLPGHGLPWSGPMMPHAAALIDWHRRAALALRDHLPDEPGPTAFEIVAARRPEDAREKPHRLRGEVAETLAFLLWMESEGLVGRQGDAPARWYRLAGRHGGA